MHRWFCIVLVTLLPASVFAADFHPSTDSLTAEIDSNGVARLPLTIQNTGDGSLHWFAKTRPAGDAGSATGTLRQSLNVGQATDDDRIAGVAFDGERYYAAGANGAYNGLIYILNREGALLDSFPQPNRTRYGMKDLEWDGELLWGSGDSTIYGFDRQGRVRHSWVGLANPNNNFAWDPEGRVLWVYGGTDNNNIYCCNRDGNDTNRTLDRKNLRIYGLAWYCDDPDGYRLYLLNVPEDGLAPSIYKMNVATNDTIKVADIEVPPACTGASGAFICNSYDRYRGAVFICTLNIPSGDGGDAIYVLQLQPNEEWLTVDPPAGEVPAGESRQIEVVVSTVALDCYWSFDLGEYDGEIVFTHDGDGGGMTIPVHLTVRRHNSVNPDDASTPTSFGFTSLYPQPFNSTLTISYTLTSAGLVSLTLTDFLGREVFGRTGVPPVSNEFQSVGLHRALFDATGLPSGVYLARLNAGGKRSVVKVVCLK